MLLVWWKLFITSQWMISKIFHELKFSFFRIFVVWVIYFQSELEGVIISRVGVYKPSTVITCCNSLCINKYGNTKSFFVFWRVMKHEKFNFTCVSFILLHALCKYAILKGVRRWYVCNHVHPKRSAHEM